MTVPVTPAGSLLPRGTDPVPEPRRDPCSPGTDPGEAWPDNVGYRTVTHGAPARAARHRAATGESGGRAGRRAQSPG